MHMRRMDGRLFLQSRDLGWGITGYNIGAGPNISQGAGTLSTRETAIVADVGAIETPVK
jgi:hypothetical protein